MTRPISTGHVAALRCLPGTLPAAAAWILCGTATAQQPAAVAQEPHDTLEEVIVAAQRRDERLQDVPIATTVLSASELQQAGIGDTPRLAQLTPNLTYGGGFEGVSKIALRGVVTNDFLQNLNPAVGTYVDEVYMGLATGQLLQLYDMERVEVLRGPQGTLYGKNTTAGAINYLSNRPKLGQYTTSLSAALGNYQRRDIEGAINAPIGKRAAVRAAFTSRDRDGFVDNWYTGADARALNVWGARAQLYIEPVDSFDLLAKVYAGERRGDALNRMTIGTLSPTPPSAGNPRRRELFGVQITGISRRARPMSRKAMGRPSTKPRKWAQASPCGAS